MSTPGHFAVRTDPSASGNQRFIAETTARGPGSETSPIRQFLDFLLLDRSRRTSRRLRIAASISTEALRRSTHRCGTACICFAVGAAFLRHCQAASRCKIAMACCNVAPEVSCGIVGLAHGVSVTVHRRCDREYGRAARGEHGVASRSGDGRDDVAAVEDLGSRFVHPQHWPEVAWRRR